MVLSPPSPPLPLLDIASRSVFFLAAVPLWPDCLFALAATEPYTPSGDAHLTTGESTDAHNAIGSKPDQPATPEPEGTQPSNTGPSSPPPDDGEDKEAANVIPVPTPVNSLSTDKNGTSTPAILMGNLTDLLPAAPTDPDDGNADGDPGDDPVTVPAPQTPSTDPSASSSDPQTPAGNNATKGKQTDTPSTDNSTAPPKESSKAGSASPIDKATEGTKSTPGSTNTDSSDLTTPSSVEDILCAPLNTSAISVTYSNGTNVILTAHAESVLDITNDKNGSTIEVWDHDIGVDVNCTVVLPPKKEKKQGKPQEGTPIGTPVSGDGSAGSTQNGNGDDTTPQPGSSNGESIVGHPHFIRLFESLSGLVVVILEVDGAERVECEDGSPQHRRSSFFPFMARAWDTPFTFGRAAVETCRLGHRQESQGRCEKRGRRRGRGRDQEKDDEDYAGEGWQRACREIAPPRGCCCLLLHACEGSCSLPRSPACPRSPFPP